MSAPVPGSGPGPVVVAVAVNGERRELPADATVEDVVHLLLPSPRGCAVALNGEVVVRTAWATTRLSDGDACEVLTLAPGG